MTGIIRKPFLSFCLILLLGLFFTEKANAATFASASATLSTSRPSAAAPITANLASGVGQVTVVDLPGTLNNSALWLASDSATFIQDTGETRETLNVASMSASNTPAANQRIVYFTSTTANTHHAGVTLITPVTATHTIRFRTITTVPGSGHIVINLPGVGSNIASPSATGFSINGLTSANASANIQTNGATCSSYVVSNNSIDCTLNGSGIPAATNVSFIIGCTSQSGGTCTSFLPRLINPIKSTAAVGTADQWKIRVRTQDASATPVDLDSTTLVVAPIESVTVQATVEPYITFTIAGRTNGSTACSDVTNSAIDPTATFVNLGSLSSAQVNRSAQRLTVDTNGSFGYTITATSSGRFINPASGVYLSDANGGNGLTGIDLPAPAPVTAGVAEFGVHPCSVSGSNTPIVSATWGTGGGGSNNYSNPWNTGTNGYYASISYYYAPAATSQTDVVYAASAASTTPAGTYYNHFTYVATPIF